MNYLHSLLLLLIMRSLVSLNTQGLRSPDCRKSAFNFFRIHKYEIIFLQEIHWTTDLQDAIQCEWTGDIYFNNGTANSGGVAILFNPHFNCTHTNTSQDSSGHVLAITIKIDDHYLQLVNLYAPNSDTAAGNFFLLWNLFSHPVITTLSVETLILSSIPCWINKEEILPPDNTLSVLYTPSLLNLI